MTEDKKTGCCSAKKEESKAAEGGCCASKAEKSGCCSKKRVCCPITMCCQLKTSCKIKAVAALLFLYGIVGGIYMLEATGPFATMFATVMVFVQPFATALFMAVVLLGLAKLVEVAEFFLCHRKAGACQDSCSDKSCDDGKCSDDKCDDGKCEDKKSSCCSSDKK